MHIYLQDQKIVNPQIPSCKTYLAVMSVRNKTKTDNKKLNGIKKIKFKLVWWQAITGRFFEERLNILLF